MSFEQRLQAQRELNEIRRNFITTDGLLNKWAFALFDFKRNELKAKGYAIVLNDDSNNLEIERI